MARPISFEEPFGYPFKDPTWPTKLGLGGLIAMLLLVFLLGGIVMLGYCRRLFLALVQDPSARLPEFDFINDVIGGAPAALIIFIYLIPGAIVSQVACIGSCIGLLYEVLLLIALPAILMLHFTTGRFASAFEFDRIYRFITANLNNLALVAAITLIAGIASGLGVAACFVGFFFVLFWGSLVVTKACAETWRASLEAALPPPAAPTMDGPTSP